MIGKDLIAMSAVDQDGNSVNISLSPGAIEFAVKKMNMLVDYLNQNGLQDGRKSLQMADGTMIHLKPTDSFNKIMIIVPQRQQIEEGDFFAIRTLLIAPEYQIATGWDASMPAGWKTATTEFLFKEEITYKNVPDVRDYLNFPMIVINPGAETSVKNGGVPSAIDYDERKLTRVEESFPDFYITFGDPVIDNTYVDSTPYPVYDMLTMPWPNYWEGNPPSGPAVDGSAPQVFDDAPYTITTTTPWSISGLTDGNASGSVVTTRVITGTTRYWVFTDALTGVTWVWICSECITTGLNRPDLVHVPEYVSSREEGTVQTPPSVVTGWSDPVTGDYAYILQRTSDYSYVTDDSGTTGGDYTISFYLVSGGVESLIWTSPTINIFTDPVAGSCPDFKVYREGKDDFFVVFSLLVAEAVGPS